MWLIWQRYFVSATRLPALPVARQLATTPTPCELATTPTPSELYIPTRAGCSVSAVCRYSERLVSTPQIERALLRAVHLDAMAWWEAWRYTTKTCNPGEFTPAKTVCSTTLSQRMYCTWHSDADPDVPMAARTSQLGNKRANHTREFSTK